MRVEGVVPHCSPDSDTPAVSANCLAVAWRLYTTFLLKSSDGWIPSMTGRLPVEVSLLESLWGTDSPTCDFGCRLNPLCIQTI